MKREPLIHDRRLHGKFAAWRDNESSIRRNIVHIVEIDGWITRLCDSEHLIQLESAYAFALHATTATCLLCIAEWGASA